MKKIITRWAYLNYDLEGPIDYSMLFSEDVDDGWTIESLSTAVDSTGGNRIIVITALLSR